ncbi:MAG: SDR family oxidoreductase [Nocardioides sp.]|nr:SDR family oxidoreductase [Nocardioides sp.]
MDTSCVVTGAARGIGRGIAERMVARGHRVVITDVDEVGVARTAAEIGAVEGVVQDVRDADSHRAVAEAASRHGVLTAWFNNAGIGDDGMLAELTDEQVRRLVDINLMGVLWGSRAALDAFEPSGGDIVNTASLSGLGPVPGLSVYAATKAAVVSVTESLAAEVPKGVRVHALCPDGVATQLVADMRDDGLAKALVHSGGRMLGVDEVADEAVALVGSRRIVRTLPAWRGGLMRVSALAPALVVRGSGVFAAQGRRAMRKSSS